MTAEMVAEGLGCYQTKLYHGRLHFFEKTLQCVDRGLSCGASCVLIADLSIAQSVTLELSRMKLDVKELVNGRQLEFVSPDEIVQKWLFHGPRYLHERMRSKVNLIRQMGYSQLLLIGDGEQVFSRLDTFGQRRIQEWLAHVVAGLPLSVVLFHEFSRVSTQIQCPLPDPQMVFYQHKYSRIHLIDHRLTNGFLS